jgi:hypothetical protein
MEGIQVCSNEGDSPYPMGNKSTLKIFKNLLHNQQAKFNQTFKYTLSLGEENSSLFK